MLLRKLIVRTLLQIGVFAALLFVPAGTVDWWQAWLLLGLLFIGSCVISAALYPRHKDILEERLKPPLQKGQPLADKVLVLALLATLLGATALIPLDVFQFHFLASPPFAASALGLVLVCIGSWVGYRTLVANAFAALAVKPQQKQRVIDTGPYAVIRHPMYAGASLFCLGLPLWLGSAAAALAMLAPIAMLGVRCVFEERFLRRKLEGYGDYMRRVRWRFVPGVW